MIAYGKDYTDENGEPLRDLLGAVRTGTWLDKQTFPPLRWAIPGLIPEGFTLLIGPPKAGKSWLALSVQLSVACGGTALGAIRVPAGRVLYLALEDGDRRMQDRCRTLMADVPLPAKFCYVTQVNPGEVIATIEAFVEAYPDTALVVVDTLGKVMPQAMPNETTYQRDYRIGGRIKAIADAHPGLAVVALHHDRKAGSEDFVERVSGTNGLAGAADTIIVLSRARQSVDGTLAVTGRDVLESEYAITMTGGSWELDGRNLAEAANRAIERESATQLGDQSTAVLHLVNQHPDGITPAKVAAALGMDNKTVGTYLGRLEKAGRVGKVGRGLYTPVVSVESVESADLDHADPNTFNTFHGGPEDVPLWDEPCRCGRPSGHRGWRPECVAEDDPIYEPPESHGSPTGAWDS